MPKLSAVDWQPVPRERYLLRADREKYTYRAILETRPGSVRLLVPADPARRLHRAISTLIALAYVFLAASVFQILAGASLLASGLEGILVAAFAFAAFFAGLFAFEIWWDNRSLPLLAESPAASIALEVFRMRSFGTFQEVEARAEGMEIRVTVHGSREKVAEAIRFAGLFPAG